MSSPNSFVNLPDGVQLGRIADAVERIANTLDDHNDDGEKLMGAMVEEAKPESFGECQHMYADGQKCGEFRPLSEFPEREDGLIHCPFCNSTEIVEVGQPNNSSPPRPAKPTPVVKVKVNVSYERLYINGKFIVGMSDGEARVLGRRIAEALGSEVREVVE